MSQKDRYTLNGLDLDHERALALGSALRPAVPEGREESRCNVAGVKHPHAVHVLRRERGASPPGPHVAGSTLVRSTRKLTTATRNTRKATRNTRWSVWVYAYTLDTFLTVLGCIEAGYN